MWLTANNFTPVFWFAVVPALLSFLDPVRGPRAGAAGRPAPVRTRSAATSLAARRAYWWVVAVATVFTLARFSEAFLSAGAVVGLAIALVPAVLVVMNVVYALAAYPAGVLSDRIDRMTVLAVGSGLLVAADVVLALCPRLLGVALGVVAWGLHMGFTQGLLATLVADTAPAELRGTAFGVFNL